VYTAAVTKTTIEFTVEYGAINYACLRLRFSFFCNFLSKHCAFPKAANNHNSQSGKYAGMGITVIRYNPHRNCTWNLEGNEGGRQE